MKNVFLYIIFLLIGGKSLGQGVDVIFLLDNSHSVEGIPTGSVPPNTEYSEMYDYVHNLMENVLECNPNNRVTVAQYSFGGGANPYQGPKIYLQSDFSNVDVDFEREYYYKDGLYMFLDILANALWGVPDTNLSGVATLTRTPGNSLVLYIITDGGRSDSVAGGLNTAFAFQEFDEFKTNFDATIMCALVHTNSTAVQAAAAISSVGGSYTGAIESYPTATTIMALPRFLINKSSFDDLEDEISLVAEEICSVGEPSCDSNVILTSPDEDAIVGYLDYHQSSDIITASNFIDFQSVGVYHGEDTVVLSHLFHADYGCEFRAYIDGCSDTFYGRQNMYMEEDPRGKEVKDFTLFSLAPNPAAESVFIKSDKVMTNITITSMQGVVLFNRDVKANNYELNISNYIKGFYVVNVTTDDGQTETQKLIKE